jgi:hypothetical protein
MPLVNGKISPLELPRKHTRVLFDVSKKWRIRAMHGGRNGGKDWAFASALIERAVRAKTRVLCTREIQNTIQDSIKTLLEDTINRLGYAAYFVVTKNEIVGSNGSNFIFRGLRDLNADNIKSLEGVDICMLGEAQNLTKKSWNILSPTIRKPDSEIWIQFNDQFDDDFVYDLCVVNPPEDMIVEHVNWTDLPQKWVSGEIAAQAERMQREDPDLYRNIWLGEPLGGGGRVFPQYTSDIHEIDFDLNVLPLCNLYMSIDPHRKYFPAIKWYAVTPTSATVLYNEWPRYEEFGMWYDEARHSKTFDLTLKELANRILANDLTQQYGGKILARTGDPHFFAEAPDFVRTLIEHGVGGWVEAPFERIETQRENLKSLMGFNPALPMAGPNMPEWYVDKRCRNSCRAYKRHCYDEKHDKEGEENKDFIDADRYFLSIVDGRPVYQEPPKPITGHGGLVSLTQHLMAGRPVQGYGREIK